MTRDLNSPRIVNGFPWWGTKEDPIVELTSEASVNHPILFLKLSFDSADVNLHSGVGDVTFGGDTYTGVGKLGAISGIEENADLARTPIEVGLAGLPNDILSAMLNEHYQGRLATVYLGYRDTTTYQLIADPMIIYRGLMNKPSIKAGKTANISLSIESRFAQWDRPRIRRYTNEDQRSRYASDTFFQFMEQGVEKRIVWGGKAPQ